MKTITEFAQIEDDFLSYLEEGLTRYDVADLHCLSHEQIDSIIDNNEHALQTESRCCARYKFTMRQAINKEARAGKSTAITALAKIFDEDKKKDNKLEIVYLDKNGEPVDPPALNEIHFNDY